MEPLPSTLPELLDCSARLYGERRALAMRRGLRDDRWTYRRLQLSSHAWAAALTRQGLKPGDRLLVKSPNSPNLVAAMFGAFRAGVVLVPLDLQTPAQMTRRIAAATEARAMLIPSHAEAVDGLRPIATDQPPALIEHHAGHTVQPDDLAEIVFTSGTTGQPKGVQLTHRNITHNVRSASVLPHGPDHRLVSLLPLSHMLEQTGGLFFPLSSGASVAYVGSLRSSAIMAALLERRPTTLVVVPQLLELLYQAIERDVERRGRLSHWQVAHRVAGSLPRALRRLIFLPVLQALGGSLDWIFCGGAPLKPELQAAWLRLGITVMQGYGATECAPFVTCQRPGDGVNGTAGRPLPAATSRRRSPPLR